MKIPKTQVPAEQWAEKAEREIETLPEWTRSCLEAWKKSRQVFKVNDALWRELEKMDLDDIPASAFSHLPYPCMYIQHEWETKQGMALVPGLSVKTKHTGMFCWIEDGTLFMADHIKSMVTMDSRNGRIIPSPARQNSLSLTKFDLTGGISIKDHIDHIAQRTRPQLEKVFMATPERRAMMQRDPEVIDGLVRDYKQGLMYAPAAAALMYIASRNADLECVYRPASNLPKKSRQSRSTITEVGYKIAPKLRELRAAAPTPEPSERQSNEARKAPAPHIRRAHWHGYWTGPKDDPTGLDIKWIAPVLVNAPRAEAIGTIHELDKVEGASLGELSARLSEASAALDREPSAPASEKAI